jgi:hypothetical protein
MTDVMTAYTTLLELAAAGRAYVDGEVFNPVPTEENDPRRTTVVGHGFDFERTMPVVDRTTDQPVNGTAKLRVLHLTKGEELKLFLRARLEWTTSTGDEHASYACYQITATAAAQLAAKEPEDPSAAENFDPAAEPTPEEYDAALGALFEAVNDAVTYEAVWQQTFPGSDNINFNAMFELTDAEQEALATASKYHEKAVVAAKAAEPQLLGMLAFMDMGDVGPAELGQLLEWVTAQPEVAVLSRS